MWWWNCSQWLKKAQEDLNEWAIGHSHTSNEDTKIPLWSKSWAPFLGEGNWRSWTHFLEGGINFRWRSDPLPWRRNLERLISFPEKASALNTKMENNGKQWKTNFKYFKHTKEMAPAPVSDQLEVLAPQNQEGDWVYIPHRFSYCSQLHEVEFGKFSHFLKLGHEAHWGSSDSHLRTHQKF